MPRTSLTFVKYIWIYITYSHKKDDAAFRFPPSNQLKLVAGQTCLEILYDSSEFRLHTLLIRIACLAPLMVEWKVVFYEYFSVPIILITIVSSFPAPWSHHSSVDVQEQAIHGFQQIRKWISRTNAAPTAKPPASPEERSI